MASDTDVLTACSTASGLCPTDIRIHLKFLSCNFIQKREKHHGIIIIALWIYYWEGRTSILTRCGEPTPPLRMFPVMWSFSGLASVSIFYALFLLYCSHPSSASPLKHVPALVPCTFAIMRPGKLAERQQQCAWTPLWNQMASNEYIQRWLHTPQTYPARPKPKVFRRQLLLSQIPKKTFHSYSSTTQNKRKSDRRDVGMGRDSILNQSRFKYVIFFKFHKNMWQREESTRPFLGPK